MHRALIVVTSHAALGDSGEKTGFWLEELAVPYRAFARAGFEVTLASPRGGRPPADPRSEAQPSDDVKWFLADAEAASKLEHTIALEDVKPGYDAVFLAGGHGTVWDLPGSRPLAALLGRTYGDGGVVAAVCHGPAGLVSATKPDGTPLVQGLQVTAFSDEEERAMKLERVVPFLLESRLRELGGRYERGPNWASFALRDGRLVTGQNPASSLRTAELVIEALAERR